MNEIEFKGARWWKFDFHTHTPKSMDFNKEYKDMSPESWLKAFMDEGIDCVAITDHNSGDWIDDLKQVLKDIKSNPPDWYKPLYLFPGVEISAHGNVHILAIFDSSKNKSDIDNLLDAVKYDGTKGDSDAVTKKSLTEVINEVFARGGIPIPAHTDKKRGLFEEFEGLILQQILDNECIDAIELCYSTYPTPEVYMNKKDKCTEIRGSDTHSCNDQTFGIYTWIKMDEPTIEGLKLALQDGDVSVNRNMKDNPNKLPKNFIEKLEITNAKYIGRLNTLVSDFSPFLNAIIGGRGTGKSTLLELIRFVMRRDKDIPEPLIQDSLKYFTSEKNESLLLTDTNISLLYWKNNIHYRLNWYNKEDYPSLEQGKDDGTWEPVQGDIRSMFPAYIYSQKQIFELARNPRALINIIDDAPIVDADNINTQIRELRNRYKQIENRQQELIEKINQKERLHGELSDLARQIEYIEKSDHKEVMQKYRLCQQQLNEIGILEDNWEETLQQLLELRGKVKPAAFNQDLFSDNQDILTDLKRTNDNWLTIQNRLKKIEKEAESIINEWQAEKKSASWMQDIEFDIERYKQLSSDLESEGIEPEKYHLLFTQQKSIQKELDLIDEYQALKQTLDTEKQEEFEKIRKYRITLTEKRQKFLIYVLQDNQFVGIKVLPFGEEWSEIENEIRSILQCQDRFDRDFEGLKEIYQPDDNRNIENLKDAVKDIRNGITEARDNRFAKHLKGLPQESISDFLMWFPRDNLEVTYGPDQQLIQRGSPGQKTAALLAFILSYGDEPLLLDQPEDDLDNKLIYNLIVQQLRKIKTKRQVIVVTHNANIVVNGDAEMVLPLEVVNGQTNVQPQASIQQKKIRESICNILEGGEKAFEQRYKRIHLGD